jgi:hypothetical protein
MDDETRYWIAKQVADTKYTSDISPLFRKDEKAIGYFLTTSPDGIQPNNLDLLPYCS